MEILAWLLADVLLFIGFFLILFPEKFLSYDSKWMPNFWDNHHKRDIVLINWKSRKRLTLIVGIIFLVGGLLVFLNIYITTYTRLA